MKNDSIANGCTLAGLFSYVMKFQAELTLLLVLTGLLLNFIRIYDRFKNKKKPQE